MLQWSAEDALKLNVQMKVVEPTLEAGAQIQQLLTAECIEDYADAPTIEISFRYNGTQQKFSIKLPLSVNKFFEPTEMNAESFFARWKNLSGYLIRCLLIIFNINCAFVVNNNGHRKCSRLHSHWICPEPATSLWALECNCWTKWIPIQTTWSARASFIRNRNRWAALCDWSRTSRLR